MRDQTFESWLLTGTVHIAIFAFVASRGCGSRNASWTDDARRLDRVDGLILVDFLEPVSQSVDLMLQSHDILLLFGWLSVIADRFVEDVKHSLLDCLNHFGRFCL